MNNMKNFLQAVKAAAIEAWQAEKPCDVLTGVVLSVSPLKIQIESSVVLSSGLVTVLKGLELNAGDSVVMIKKTGGQRFYVIGTV